MTWVLGWPFTIEYARGYIREHRLLLNVDNPRNLLILYTAYEDIDIRVNDNHLTALVCWVGSKSEVVLGICVDYEARTAAKAVPRRSRMVAKAAAYRLASLLKAKEPPEWYRYDDGTYTPWEGELCDYPDDDSDEEYSEGGFDEYDEEECDAEECDEGRLDVVEKAEEEIANEQGAVVASDNALRAIRMVFVFRCILISHNWCCYAVHVYFFAVSGLCMT
ncbi:hypothetical protein A0H81_05731 [Grifola frondosa]|uniref:Uncharacterized protein n=1 Tax=Grifola frondosa TaxID=5627 RepID=A0A1C7MC14_GRIFR|nr:hypothetical protein A0H81_05731 [Grifola frondosa]